MPFIGSFATKTIDSSRSDIEIISANPNVPVQQARLLLHCSAVGVGRIIYQTMHPVMGEWVSQMGPPPFLLFSSGTDFNPHPAQLVPLQVVDAANYSFFVAPQNTRMHLEIANHLLFTYGDGDHRISFRQLRFIPQVQQALLATHVQAQ